MVWAGILGNRIVGPFFLEERVTAASYTRLLTNDLIDFLEQLPENESDAVIFQQDGHPAHTSHLAVYTLNHLFPGRWIGSRGPRPWPPRSPDLSPVDFFLWGYIKNCLKVNPPQTRPEMVAAIRAAFLTITPEMLANMRRNFMKRVVTCAENDGQHFEHLL